MELPLIIPLGKWLCRIKQDLEKNDVVEVNLPMEIRKVIAGEN